MNTEVKMWSCVFTLCVLLDGQVWFQYCPFLGPGC